MELPALVKRMPPMRPHLTTRTKRERDEPESNDDTPQLVVTDRSPAWPLPHPSDACPWQVVALDMYSVRPLGPDDVVARARHHISLRASVNQNVLDHRAGHQTRLEIKDPTAQIRLRCRVQRLRVRLTNRVLVAVPHRWNAAEELHRHARLRVLAESSTSGMPIQQLLRRAGRRRNRAVRGGRRAPQHALARTADLTHHQPVTTSRGTVAPTEVGHDRSACAGRGVVGCGWGACRMWRHRHRSGNPPNDP